MKSLQGIAAIVLMFCMSLPQASTALTAQVKDLLKDELYPVTSVLPGYRRPAKNAPRLAVAEFRTDSDRHRSWSQAVSEILRYRIQYVPGVRLYMPAPYYTHTDAQADEDDERGLLTGTEAFKVLNQTLGIDKVLTGRVDFSADRINLEAELVKARSGKTLYQRDWNFAEKQLPAVLIELSKWVYQKLGVKLSPQEMAYLEDPGTLEYAAIEDFVSNYVAFRKLDGPLRRDKVMQLQGAHPNFVMLSVYALHNRTYARNLEDAYNNLEFYQRVRNQHQGNAGVALESFRVMETSALPKHKVARQLDKFRELTGANSQDPTMMINIASTLVDNGDTHEAVSVMLEAAERWPEQYRAWWSLGWALNKHAWQIRGNSSWRDVPERAKQEFKTLTLLSDKSIDRALSLNSRHGDLWSMKIDSLGSRDGYSEELLDTFDRAVKVDPTHKYIYLNAINYATNRWGGDSYARSYIIDTAETHNPEVAWVGVMKQDYGAENRLSSASSVLDRFIDFLKSSF